jgi:hypothetical protein
VSAHDGDREPERLIDGKLGELLRDANREFATELDQPAAFRRVTERLASSRKRRWSSGSRWLVPAAPFAAAALAAVLALAYKQRADVAPELVAETWRSPAESPTAAVAAPTGSEESPPPRAEPKRGPREVKRSVAIVPVAPLPSASELRAAPSAVPPLPGAPEAAAPAAAPAPDCLSLARQGQTRDAEACFLERAQGSGLGAEMALYEVARLRRDVLADANGALQALAEYRRRFPSGSLRREADMSQLELLLQLGRSDDALKQSDELLSSSASGERATELRSLRGHILRKQSRFAEAAREYELAEGAGARGGEATYFRALCLEALGRSGEAATSFSKYLEQPQRPYAEDARRRLERLKP